MPDGTRNLATRDIKIAGVVISEGVGETLKGVISLTEKMFTSQGLREPMMEMGKIFEPEMLAIADGKPPKSFSRLKKEKGYTDLQIRESVLINSDKMIKLSGLIAKGGREFDLVTINEVWGNEYNIAREWVEAIYRETPLWSAIEAKGKAGREKQSYFDVGFNELKDFKHKLPNGEVITAKDIKTSMDLKANYYVDKGNIIVRENVVRERVNHSVKFAEFLPKDILKQLEKNMTPSQAKGFLQHILGLHQRVSFLNENRMAVEKDGVLKKLIINEQGEYIGNKDFTRAYERVLKKIGLKPNQAFDGLKIIFKSESQLRSGNKKINETKDGYEKLRLTEEVFNPVENKSREDLYHALESAKQDYIYAAKTKKEFISRANWMYSLAKANSNLIQGVRQTVATKYLYEGLVKSLDRIKLEHLKASVVQSVQAANLVVGGKFKSAGKEMSSDFIGLTGPKSLLDMIDLHGGTVNSSGLYRMALIAPGELMKFRSLDNPKRTLYNDVVDKFIAEVGPKEFAKQQSQAKEVFLNNNKMLESVVGKSYSKLKGRDQLKDLMTIAKATNLGRLSGKKARGMSTFDFDETVGISENFVIAKKGKETKRIASDKWPFVGEKMIKEGWKMDFSDFNKVTGGKPGPLMQKMKNQIAKYGPENVFILTARAKESAKAIHEYLKSEGIKIPLENITGLGNSTGEAKALWMLEKFAEGYNDMYFVDDALPNVKAVKEVLDQLDIKSNVQIARQFSRTKLSKDFNKILEEVKGIEAKKTYSEAKGRLAGTKKGKWKVFGTPGMEDFAGLVTYAFSGKGKRGEAHIKFFNDNLQKPFNRAYNEIHNRKQAIDVDYKALRKSMPTVRKSLEKPVAGVYNVDQAIRVYNWNKAGYEVPGLSKTDLKKLLNYVESNPKVAEFANKLSKITMLQEGYLKPGENWLGENITMDMNNVVDRVYRNEALAEFKQNRKEIFGEWKGGRIIGENMSKIEAAYGPKHREALENMLWRMENGTNRTVGADSNTNKWMNWVNDATGTIMFFNQKSAVLQTISSLNYVNGTFNNPFRAAQAFANQPQYWKDFAMIFNSNMLVQRRAGLKINIEAAELLERVGNKKGGFSRFRKYLLEKGFIPTKYADSFAIASGGATFYRNSVRKYKKQGMSIKEAEAKAWEDFMQMTEATQQSSRPDLISMQQASALGRPILAFANTPMQMFRRHKRRIQDIANRRGNTVENIASALYYGFAQTMIFSFLSNAMFAVDDESDDPKDIKHAEKQKGRYVQTIVDSYMRGMGTGGAAVSALKNGLLRFFQESEKHNPDYANVVIDMLNVSPPIGSKARKLYSAGRTYKYDRDIIPHMGFSIDNPATLAIANVISATTNLPTDRVVMKLTNLKDASNSDFEVWQRIAMSMGVSKWSMGLRDEKLESEKDAIEDVVNKKKKKEKKIQKKKETKENNKSRIEANKKKKDGKCAAISRSGNRCRNKAEAGSFCTIHAKVKQNKSGKKTQCKRIKSNKKRCKMQTSASSGYCYYHD
jgi:hypothetical protein